MKELENIREVREGYADALRWVYQNFDVIPEIHRHWIYTSLFVSRNKADVKYYEALEGE